MEINILLLQARYEDDLARIEERQSFAARAGLQIQQIIPHDLLSGPPTLDQICFFDALMIGGSGAFSVSQNNLPNQDEVLEVLAEVVQVGHPTFASCYGFHLLVSALGGNIIYDPDNMEVGTYEITLSPAGQEDELFQILPAKFMAQLGHKDQAAELPDGLINLASSKRAPFQAFRVPGKPIWATQFHPELTGQDNLLRFHRYQDEYASIYGPEQLKMVLERFNESPETDHLITQFLKTVFS